MTSRDHLLVSGAVQVRVESHDGHRRWSRAFTGLALVTLLIAVAMALFGLPPVDIHGPLHYTGIMDPLCGGTRAARLTAQGDIGQAWEYNPLGIAAVGGAALLTARTLAGALMHRWVNLYVRLSPTQKRITVVVALALLVALEIRQQQRADLLMARG